MEKMSSHGVQEGSTNHLPNNKESQKHVNKQYKMNKEVGAKVAFLVEKEKEIQIKITQFQHNNGNNINSKPKFL